jgi:hypothetical protein
VQVCVHVLKSTLTVFGVGRLQQQCIHDLTGHQQQCLSEKPPLSPPPMCPQMDHQSGTAVGRAASTDQPVSQARQSSRCCNKPPAPPPPPAAHTCILWACQHHQPDSSSSQHVNPLFFNPHHRPFPTTSFPSVSQLPPLPPPPLLQTQGTPAGRRVCRGCEGDQHHLPNSQAEVCHNGRGPGALQAQPPQHCQVPRLLHGCGVHQHCDGVLQCGGPGGAHQGARGAADA